MERRFLIEAMDDNSPGIILESELRNRMETIIRLFTDNHSYVLTEIKWGIALNHLLHGDKEQASLERDSIDKSACRL